ncbi:MAG: prephenate dehydratase domain-containing protein [Pirellulaceae bacterium]|nr:prephenate dehydratase domain-containing protein [Pirellulaceae bacterium]
MTDISVAFLGPAHTYSHLAAQTVQPDETLLLPCDTIDHVFAAIESRQARCGLVPLFNTSSGLVSDSVVAIVRRLVDSSNPSGVGSPGSLQVPKTLSQDRPTAQLCISESLVIAIEHCLVSWGTLSTIRVVSSKQQALEQCRQWLDEHLPQATRIPTDSSAAALNELRRHPEQAAIVSRPATISLAAPLCLESIQDQVENATEFVVVQLDSDQKPILQLQPDRPNQARCEYLISEVRAESRIAALEYPAANLTTLGQWSGRVCHGGVWYEACKRPLEIIVSPYQPWTGEVTISPNMTEPTKDANQRAWRLGIG